MITVQTRDLQAALSKLKHRLGDTTLLITRHVLITQDESCVILTRTDVDSRGVVRIPASNLTDFAPTAAPHALLSKTVRKLTSDNLVLSNDPNGLRVTSGSVWVSLDGTDVGNFPAPLTLEGGQTALLPVEAFARVLHGTAEEDSRFRPMLYGVLVDQDLLVAADGFRLCLQPVESGLEGKVLIRRDAVEAICKVAKKGDVEITATDKMVQMVWDNYTITFPLVSGTYPRYEERIPSLHDWHATIDVEAFRQSLEPVGALAQGRSGIMRFKADAAGILITTQAEDIGQAEIKLEAEVEGAGKIALHYRYLMEMLRVCPEQQVVMSCSGSANAALFTSGDYREVIMPMWVQW